MHKSIQQNIISVLVMTLLNYRLLSEAQGARWWTKFQIKWPQEKMTWWSLLRTGPREGMEELHREVKARGGQRGRHYGLPLLIPFIRVCGVEYYGVPWLRLNWAIQTKNNGFLLNSMKILSKGHTGGRSWEAGETVDHDKGIREGLPRT